MKIAIFDFDGTLFPMETIPFFIKQYSKLGYSKFKRIQMMAKLIPDVIVYKLAKNPDKEGFRHKAVYTFLSLFEGMTKEEVDSFFKKNVEVIGDLLDEEVVMEVTKRKEEGYHTVLLSGCFDMLLKPLGETLGFDEIIGTQLVFSAYDNQKERMISSTPIHIISGENKLSAAMRLGYGADVDWSESIGYADSCYDQPMLELVGQKVAVNPDGKLHSIAVKKQWKIMITKKGMDKVKYS